MSVGRIVGRREQPRASSRRLYVWTAGEMRYRLTSTTDRGRAIVVAVAPDGAVRISRTALEAVDVQSWLAMSDAARTVAAEDLLAKGAISG
jgi:hypothetical protein